MCSAYVTGMHINPSLSSIRWHTMLWHSCGATSKNDTSTSDDIYPWHKSWCQKGHLSKSLNKDCALFCVECLAPKWLFWWRKNVQAVMCATNQLQIRTPTARHPAVSIQYSAYIVRCENGNFTVTLAAGAEGGARKWTFTARVLRTMR